MTISYIRLFTNNTNKTCAFKFSKKSKYENTSQFRNEISRWNFMADFRNGN